MDSALLQIRGLTKKFGSVTAVDDLSFDVRGGEIVGLLGPNGAGKTTTIRCIASILKPTKGTAIVNGHDVRTETSLAKKHFAYVPEVPSVFDMLTVMEHLRFVAAAFGSQDRLSQAQEILERLDMWDKRTKLGSGLSKGMKQKLACACALIHDATVLCLDEPWVGLDPKGVRELKDMLFEQRAAGRAILVSTHMLDTAERLCDRVVIMNQGRFIAEGSLEELSTKTQSTSTLEEMFLELTGAGI
ncbi:MAG TPA: ABC transporter ATP-binding protein [Fimbriimonas sp.]|nr:ABC transporter ATP-binding protein [Fimbriimonas sp.]